MEGGILSQTSPPGPLSHRPPANRERGNPQPLAFSELWVVVPPLPVVGWAMGEGARG